MNTKNEIKNVLDRETEIRSNIQHKDLWRRLLIVMRPAKENHRTLLKWLRKLLWLTIWEVLIHVTTLLHPVTLFCCSPQCSLQTADAFPVVAIFRRERSDDRKCVCCSQANLSAACWWLFLPPLCSLQCRSCPQCCRASQAGVGSHQHILGGVQAKELTVLGVL